MYSEMEESHLKIEIFAYDLFHSVWLKSGLISHKYDATEIYKDECLSDDDFKEICDKLFYEVILCRRILFQQIYMEEIKGKDTYWDSVSEFSDYIHSTCHRCDLFGCLTVFERMFATCAFVLNLCFYNRKNKNVDIITFGHICWAMYFDDFIEDFYEQGGWTQLKNVAQSYTVPLSFLQVCLKEPENALDEVTEAIESYNNFKQTSNIHVCETVSKLWVKTCIENLHKSRNNLFEFECYKSCEMCMPTEHILYELKRLCNPSALEVLQYDEECSERSVFDSDSFYLPLTPTSSQESSSRTNSFSDEIEDSLTASSLFETFSDCNTDGDFTNQSCMNTLEDISDSKLCDVISSGLDMFNQSSEFESICANLERKQDHTLSRSMAKMRLNFDTLELEETEISETENSSVASDSYSISEGRAFNVTDEITEHDEMINKQYQMLDDLGEAAESVTNYESSKVLSVTKKGQPSRNKCCEGEFANVNTFKNTALSFDNQLFLSISEWDQEDLVKNTSTPNKTEILDKD